MSEFGSRQERILSESERDESFIEHKADIHQNVNGRIIEVTIYQTKSVVTIDGREFNGSFSDAVQHCAKLPVLWSRMFS